MENNLQGKKGVWIRTVVESNSIKLPFLFLLILYFFSSSWVWLLVLMIILPTLHSTQLPQLSSESWSRAWSSSIPLFYPFLFNVWLDYTFQPQPYLMITIIYLFLVALLTSESKHTTVITATVHYCLSPMRETVILNLDNSIKSWLIWFDWQETTAQWL